jgi:aspartate dehydrogenase
MQSTSHTSPLRIGIVGFGHLGQYLYQHLQQECHQSIKDFELIFIWNRTKEALINYEQALNPALIVSTIEEGLQRLPNLVIEVAHPDIIETYAEQVLDVCDLFIGSPSALANATLEASLRKKAMTTGHAIYIGTGAFWGADDVAKMQEQQKIKSLTITMKKHPVSFKLNEPLHTELLNKRAKLEDQPGEIIIYSGPVRQLCRLAPNNVNTMAIGAILACDLGFDGVQGCLVADTALVDRHIVEIEITGPKTTLENQEPLDFRVKTVRINPAPIGVVTGRGTLLSFVSSLKRAKGRTGGIHIV